MPIQAKLKADSTGKLAIYTYDTATPDDLPFTTPLSYLSRVRFHSDLLTPAVVAVNTYTVTLPGMADTTTRVATYNLGAHGRTGTPMIMGRVQNGSAWINLNGSVILPMYAMSGLSSYRVYGAVDATGAVQGYQGTRSITLGADATNIVLHEQSSCMWTSGITGSSAALTLTIEVTVFDLNLDGAAPGDGTDAQAVSMSATEIKAKRGAWTTNKRYIRCATTGATHKMPLSKTIEFGPSPSASIAARGVCDVGGTKFRWSSYNLDVSFAASFQDVKY